MASAQHPATHGMFLPESLNRMHSSEVSARERRRLLRSRFLLSIQGDRECECSVSAHSYTTWLSCGSYAAGRPTGGGSQRSAINSLMSLQYNDERESSLVSNSSASVHHSMAHYGLFHGELDTRRCVVAGEVAKVV